MPVANRVDPVDLLRTERERLRPDKSALLVIDMQNDFCARDGYVEKIIGLDASACRSVAAPIAELVNAARDYAVPVVWVAARYEPENIPGSMRTKQLDLSDTVCCADGTWGADYFGARPEKGEAVFHKHTYSAFIRTTLARYLTENGIRTLVFAGVQTNVCVDHSVRDAFCEGFYCVVAEDCVASHTRSLHEAALQNIKLLYGDVLERRSVIQHWSSSTSQS